MRGMCQIEKPENLSFLAQILFELSQKKRQCGFKLTPLHLRPTRANILQCHALVKIYKAYEHLMKSL